MHGFMNQKEQDDFLRLLITPISSYKLSAYLTQHHIEVRKIGEPSLLRFMASNGMHTDINVDVGADELIISILDSEFSII